MPIVLRLGLGFYRWITDGVQPRYMTGSRRIKLLKVCRYWVEQRCGNYVCPIFTGEALPHWVRIASRVGQYCLFGRIVNLIWSGEGEVPGYHSVGRKAVETGRVAMVHDLVVVEVEEHLILQNRAANCAAEVVVTQERDWPQFLFRVAEPVGVCR